MTQTFISEAELTGTEAEVYALIKQAVDLRKAGDSQASFDLLSQSEVLVESVSVSRQGRFYNQSALALKDLGEYDRAILQFDRAIYCFEMSGEDELRGMVYNNLARTYSFSGNYTRAHESVDAAIKLATKREYLAQWSDQKANCYLDEGRPELALNELNKALALLVGEGQLELLAECLATKNRIERQLNSRCETVQSMVKTLSPTPDTLHYSAPSKDGSMPTSLPIHHARQIIQSNPNLAAPLFDLVSELVDQNGDPARYSAGDEVMRYAYSFTEDSELHRREYAARYHQQEIVTESESSS